ncbi:GNAT family N-acetyltransferase [Corynebacterium pseudodiphtheriticum]|uniref:GNAT family N-acetyltransferase n=1 Tax=Corynebacterium pseudodiphtheriticum TaxID=37637 RepID=UPI00234D359F|nr:GNAT family N-acetyltransferase [Corynebacterium pseudodiphtheriticum]MDC7089000.1 GNAT family N-acetyltransferase [Corynebacterium pseudodiphtheriticum]MDK4241605.1 GNAT family N-acetyltransferase [Corynebacterium pseudodiphtheriticum]MDK4322257.1 GNAT family N-acetyltransferase [Corynebacterium pseudodiphtheriticum]
MTAHNQQITNNTAESRFEITVDGKLAGFADYQDKGNVRNFNHTEVFEEFRGQGLSKPLIKFSLDHARENDLQILPTCPAYEKFLQKNEEYQDLVAEN